MYYLELLFLKLTNPFFYMIRNKCTFSKKNSVIKREHNENRFSGAIKESEQMLLEQFSFHSFVNTMPFGSYQMNLYILHLFQEQIELPKLTMIRAIDVGAKNFEYAASLHAVYTAHSKLESLCGIELDAYRRYNDLSTRLDHANDYIRPLSAVSYAPMNFLHYKQLANVITMFLPFVFKEPLLYWGLPLSEYKPEAIFSHAYSLLEPGGIWIITNQEEEEEQACHEILESLNIPYTKKGGFDSPFYPFKLKRYTTIVTK